MPYTTGQNLNWFLNNEQSPKNNPRLLIKLNIITGFLEVVGEYRQNIESGMSQEQALRMLLDKETL